MNYKFKASVLIFVVASFVGCNQPLRMYQGPRKVLSDVSRIQTESDGDSSDQLITSMMGIKSDDRVSIRRVNDREVSRNWVEVIPGSCKLELAYKGDHKVNSKGLLKIEFEAVAGHTYLVTGFERHDWTWKASVIDSVNKKTVAEGIGELYVPLEQK